MLGPLTALKSLIKTKSYNIDYPLFRLHYRATTGLILAYCAILSAKILFGDVIDCRGHAEDRGKAGFFDNICYAQGTTTSFLILGIDEIEGKLANNGTLSCMSDGSNDNNKTFYNLLKLTTVEIHRFLDNTCFSNEAKYIYPGIPMVGKDDKGLYRKEIVRHQYYQYIPILLFLQAVFFYLPHYIWKVWEKGVVSSICKELHDHRFKPDKFIESSLHFVEYIRNSLSRNKTLVYKYYICQFLLLINLIGQTLALNYIFNGNFITYGLDTFHYRFIDEDFYGFRGVDSGVYSNNVEHNNPMDYVFPKFTACQVEFLSPNGPEPTSYNFQCVLTLNVFNDKFYLMIWYWYFALIIATTAQVIYGLFYLTMPMLQRYLFDRKFGPYLSVDLRRSMTLPELFLLDLIGSNSDRFAFAALLKQLDKEERQKGPVTNHTLV